MEQYSYSANNKQFCTYEDVNWFMGNYIKFAHVQYIFSEFSACEKHYIFSQESEQLYPQNKYRCIISHASPTCMSPIF